MYVCVSGSYKPRRDIPIAVRQLKTFSPSRIRDWIREHKTKKDKATGKRVQLKVTPQSISMWFKRHPDVLHKLKGEVKEEELSKEAISETIFENGAFKQLPCIEKWILKYKAKGGKDGTLNRWLNCIKRICQGILPYGKRIEDWGLKHPRLLTLEDGMRYLAEAQKTGATTREYRLALRNFSRRGRNLEGWDEISGKLERQAGQYAYLYTKKIPQIFAWLKRMNKEAHDACYFAYKTACRTTATLEAESKYVDKEQKTIKVFEKANRNSPKRMQEKVIPQDVWEILKPRIEKGGKLFHITATELNRLLRACYKEVIPEIAEDIPMPIHFFRHQFAQHMLRETGWNYGLVATLGNWTVQTLERYYGKMDRKTALESGRKHLVNI